MSCSFGKATVALASSLIEAIPSVASLIRTVASLMSFVLSASSRDRFGRLLFHHRRGFRSRPAHFGQKKKARITRSSGISHFMTGEPAAVVSRAAPFTSAVAVLATEDAARDASPSTLLSPGTRRGKQTAKPRGQRGCDISFLLRQHIGNAGAIQTLRLLLNCTQHDRRQEA